MKPSIASASTKTADPEATRAARSGKSSDSPDRANFAPGSWDWLAYARQPDLLPEVMLAARPCLILLTTVLLVGTCAAVAYWKAKPAQDGIDLLVEHSSPNLNHTSVETQIAASHTENSMIVRDYAYEAQARSVEPATEPNLPIIVDERPAISDFVPETTVVEPRMTDDSLIAIPADVNQDLSIRVPQRGDSPMMQHWRTLGLHTVLAGAMTVATATGAEPNKDDVIVKQLGELKKSIEQLNESVKTLRSDNLNADLKASKAHADIEEIKKQLNQLRLDVDELKKTTVTKSFAIQPENKATPALGRVRLMNTYTEAVTIIVNNKVYHLQPQEIRLSEPLAAGAFTYEVLGVQSPRTRQLASNETFTVNVHPR